MKIPDRLTEKFPFRNMEKRSVRSILAMASQITNIQFEGKAENIPVFHLMDADRRCGRDIVLVLHPEKERIGTVRDKKIIWFDIQRMRNMRSALFLAKEDPDNGFVKTVVIRDNIAPI